MIDIEDSLRSVVTSAADLTGTVYFFQLSSLKFDYLQIDWDTILSHQMLKHQKDKTLTELNSLSNTSRRDLESDLKKNIYEYLSKFNEIPMKHKDAHRLYYVVSRFFGETYMPSFSEIFHRSEIE